MLLDDKDYLASLRVNKGGELMKAKNEIISKAIEEKKKNLKQNEKSKAKKQQQTSIKNSATLIGMDPVFENQAQSEQTKDKKKNILDLEGSEKQSSTRSGKKRKRILPENSDESDEVIF